MSNHLSEFKRILEINFTKNPIKGSAAVFLWGPRKTGKTTLLKQQFRNATWYDLLDSELRTDLLINPKRLREEILAKLPATVIIDEIQKVPSLLNEIHWLLENRPINFVLCGSSARKLKREADNLLGGRAVRYELLPLTTMELGEIDIDRALTSGTIPIHYLTPAPYQIIKSYVIDYLNEEIEHEARIRNIPAFSRFLNSVALTHGRLLNYANIAREAGVNRNTVKEYYQILKDTLLGFELFPWKKSKKRRLIETAKFYLFDIGVANYLCGFKQVIPHTDVYGRAFEHLFLCDIKAYLSYTNKDYEMSFWQTSTGYEVDLIVGDMLSAIEFKSANRIVENHLKSLRALSEEHIIKRKIVVSNDPICRKTSDGIEIINWKDFSTSLWQNEIIT